MSTSTRITIAGLLLLTAACTVHETPAPTLMGPSELGMRLSVQAVPDSILQDGFSQSVINIEATGADGRPVRGLPLRVETTVAGVIQDFGTLSAKNVVTGDDGRARVTYTSPPRSTDPTDDPLTVVSIRVTPLSTDFGEFPRVVNVRLVTPGVVLPPRPGGPNAPPVAQFTASSTNPAVLTTVVFDASATTDDIGSVDPATGLRRQVPCGINCSYAWDFGDGGTATGIFATHEYRNVGTYVARLTVTDTEGASGATIRSINVGAGTPPTASFTFSPAAPTLNQTVFFNAEASRAVSPRRIVSYDWNFGNGRTASGVSVTQRFSPVGTYTVTLTVTDDAGQQGTATQSVTVGTPVGPTAALTVSPTGGTTSTTFFFDASASRPGPDQSPIVEYRFTFGDATPDVVGTSPTTTHRYQSAGTYTGRVTIRDSANRTATATVSITVQ